jgi:hypothetical protein
MITLNPLKGLKTQNLRDHMSEAEKEFSAASAISCSSSEKQFARR